MKPLPGHPVRATIAGEAGSRSLRLVRLRMGTSFSGLPISVACSRRDGRRVPVPNAAARKKESSTGRQQGRASGLASTGSKIKTRECRNSSAIAALAQRCRDKGLKFGFYLSIEEWEYPLLDSDGQLILHAAER